MIMVVVILVLKLVNLMMMSLMIVNQVKVEHNGKSQLQIA